MSVYKGYSHIEALPINKRIECFKDAALDNMQKGKRKEIFLQVVEDALADEQYELAKGILMALNEFENNPQLRLI